MSVNLTGPRFKVGDRVVPVGRTRRAPGVVVEVDRLDTYGEVCTVRWSKHCTAFYTEDELEPAERWQTDAERDER